MEDWKYTQCNTKLYKTEEGLLECPRCEILFITISNRLKKLNISFNSDIDS